MATVTTVDLYGTYKIGAKIIGTALNVYIDGAQVGGTLTLTAADMIVLAGSQKIGSVSTVRGGTGGPGDTGHAGPTHLRWVPASFV